jgi:hypothetical protein
MHVYDISFMHPYKQSGRWQEELDTDIDVESNATKLRGHLQKSKYPKNIGPKANVCFRHTSPAVCCVKRLSFPQDHRVGVTRINMNTEYWLNVTGEGGRTEVLGGKTCHSEE